MKPRSLIHRALHPDQGQMIIMFAVIFTITMVMGVISVDLGLWLSERRSAVKAADLAALAGSQDLPLNDHLARENAKAWAARNGWEDGKDGVTVTVELFCSNTMSQTLPGICHKTSPGPQPCSVGQHCDSIRVSVRKPGVHIFSSFFGMGDINEGSAATAGLSVEAAEADVVLVIDNTGSMNTNYSGNPPQNRIYWAKKAAVKFVDSIAGCDSDVPHDCDGHNLGNSHIEVITFTNGGYTVEQRFSSDAGVLRAAIKAISGTKGDTAIAPGLTKAKDDLNAHVHAGSYRVVVLLSDGRNYANGDPQTGSWPNCPNTQARRTATVNAIPNLHAAADAVFTVGIGDETTCGTNHNQFCPADSCNSNELDHYLLVDIAKGPTGYYTNTEDATKLPQIFQTIAWKIAGRALTE